ncbi:MAG: nucleotidyl transferase AbiEii/AbiGii toxin family protein [Desulfobacterales bacterium]
MYRNILSEKQAELLPLLKLFSKDFYLVGGTAIALHIGHRRSIDFDLFTSSNLKKKHIQNSIRKKNFPIRHISYEDSEQLHMIINSVKVTFYHFPYSVTANIYFDDIIRLPSLRDLAAMKAFALGRRGKWKDYVDLYFLLRDCYSLSDVSQRAREIFQKEFNEKLFRQQLCYFDDVDFTESVEYVSDRVSEEEVRTFLTNIATAPF